MYYLVTGSVDLTAKPAKRVASWHFAETGGANPVQVFLRNGAVGGDIVARINLNTSTSASQAYKSPHYLLFPGGLYVTVTGTGSVVGSVDLL